MTLAAQNRQIYTIPAGIPFARALAAQLLKDNKDSPEKLSSYKILLPTRRGCRNLQEAFLQLSGGTPVMLPRLQPVGNIDEQELSLSLIGNDGAEDFLKLKPGISPLRRQLLLAQLVEKMSAFNQGYDHAIALASALGHLIDQIYTEGLDLADLHKLVPDDFASHWQVTVDFLKILSEHWPKILEEYGVIDVADRRSCLIRTLAQHWKQNPPGIPVIAAGSTGSIPATAELLKVIYEMPGGALVLPGLDQNMDEDSWSALEESHPQYGLKHLLEYIGISRDQVRLWPACDYDCQISKYRRVLSTEIMRPASTTGAWTDIATSSKKTAHFKKALENMQIIECNNEREEAQSIAVLMREVLETPEKTAVLVTPDRNLARRVVSSCARWGIAIDDSAGASLNQTLIGSFLALCLQACVSNLASVALLSLLKHPYCSSGMSSAKFNKAVSKLEKKILRGAGTMSGFSELYAHLHEENMEGSAAHEIIKFIEPVMLRVINGSSNNKPINFSDLIELHLEMMEHIATCPGKVAVEILWSGEAGEAAANFLAELSEQAVLLPPVTLYDYSRILDILMKTIIVRPSYGMHPRLKILGQLEARMIDADLVIIGGLNEGGWPPDSGHDPWMSRPMRKDFGLPGFERGIGLAAHDFVQSFCAANIAMTRSRRIDGSHSVPSRWLQRMNTVFAAACLPMQRAKYLPVMHMIEAIDRYDMSASAMRPAPVPPPDKRPNRLSVTRIEIWLKDPYSIYARYILNLKKLEPLDKPIDAAIKGSLLHNILDRFVKKFPDKIPEDGVNILCDIASDELSKLHDDPASWSFWQPRFTRLAEWFIDYETFWREKADPLKTEVNGSIELETQAGIFTLHGVADRIDRIDNMAAIIDYKSGGNFSMKTIKSGDMPQLSLEALIVSRGGFDGIPAMQAGYLGYWKLTGGGSKPGEITEISNNVGDIVRQAEDGIKALIEIYDRPETPYYSLPNPDRALRFNDYEHLARVREWAVTGDGDGDSNASGEAA